MYNQVINGLRLMKVLKNKGCMETLEGGESIVVPLEYARNGTAAWIGEFDLLDITPQDIITAAQFNYKMLAGTSIVTDFEAARNMGRYQIINLAKKKVSNLVQSMQEQFNNALYSDGTVANKIAGLEAIVSNTGTLGGISRSAQTWWQANVTAVGGALTAAAMATMYRTCSRNIWYPDIIVTTGTQYEKYEAIAVGTGSSTGYIRFDGNAKADLGFDALSYKGTPIFWDTPVPSGVMYFLTSRFLEVGCHKDHMFEMTGAQRHPFQLLTIHPCTWFGNIYPSCCNVHGKLTGLT